MCVSWLTRPSWKPRFGQGFMRVDYAGLVLHREKKEILVSFEKKYYIEDLACLIF